jgi:fatty acid desaturase
MEWNQHRIAEIRRQLRTVLPGAAYKPAPVKLWIVAAHLVVMVGMYRVIATASTVWPLVVASIVLAHSHLCLGFFGHELSHGMIVRRPLLRYAIELVVWSVNLLPATVWDVDHNRIHHSETNTPEDSFRYFARSERSLTTSLFGLLWFPNRYLKLSPTALTLPLVLNTSHLIGGLLLPRGVKPAYVTNHGHYRMRDRLAVVFELFVIAGYVLAVYQLSGASWSNFVWAGPAAWWIGSAFASIYLFTQHGLHPLSKFSDPFNSTSLTVPRWVDWLHLYNSWHVEHHVLPTVNPSYYPLVGEYLQKNFPDRYQKLSFLEVYRRLIRNPVFKEDP